MTLAQAVEEILLRSDESFVSVSQNRSRRCLYVALTELLRNSQYVDTDAQGFIHRTTVTLPAPLPIVELDNLIADREVLSVRSIYLSPEDYEGVAPNTYIDRATKEEIKKWGLADLQPRYDFKYYQVGNTLHFYPTNTTTGLEVSLEVVVSALPYDSNPAFNPAVNWGDTTELTEWMTTYFQNAVIEAAAQLFRQEIAVHVG